MSSLFTGQSKQIKKCVSSIQEKLNRVVAETVSRVRHLGPLVGIF